MDHEEYERLRADPATFATVTGHVIPDVEEIVERREAHDVVRKVAGSAQKLAEATDPRSEPSCERTFVGASGTSSSPRTASPRTRQGSSRASRPGGGTSEGLLHRLRTLLSHPRDGWAAHRRRRRGGGVGRVWTVRPL